MSEASHLILRNKGVFKAGQGPSVRPWSSAECTPADSSLAHNNYGIYPSRETYSTATRFRRRTAAFKIPYMLPG